jgi:hypothetical protein
MCIAECAWLAGWLAAMRRALLGGTRLLLHVTSRTATKRHLCAGRSGDGSAKQ